MIKIDASTYAIQKTIEYLKRYPKTYEKEKDYLESLQKRF